MRAQKGALFDFAIDRLCVAQSDRGEDARIRDVDHGQRATRALVAVVAHHRGAAVGCHCNFVRAVANRHGGDQRAGGWVEQLRARGGLLQHDEAGSASGCSRVGVRLLSSGTQKQAGREQEDEQDWKHGVQSDGRGLHNAARLRSSTYARPLLSCESPPAIFRLCCCLLLPPPLRRSSRTRRGRRPPHLQPSSHASQTQGRTRRRCSSLHCSAGRKRRRSRMQSAWRRCERWRRLTTRA